MKTAVLTKSGFDIIDKDIPKCEDDKILIKTSACGICEGDIFQYKTIKKGEIQLGHEGSGIIAKIGVNVKNFSVGDKVTALNGAYSEYFTAKADELIKIPENVDYKLALGEPIACFVHASRRFGIKKGDKVAIIGCGYMGLGCLQIAKLQGAKDIVAIDPIDWRRNTAIQLGATLAYDPKDKTPQAILEELGDFDIVIEGTGVASVIDVCTELVKEHGRIVLIGYHQSNNGLRTVNMKTWNFKAIDIMNGHVRRNDEKFEAMTEGIELIEKKALKMQTITQSYKFKEIENAFKDLINRKEGLFKAVLIF